MVNKGATFFDDDERFTNYAKWRHRPHSPNETLEKPVILELIGQVKGKRILDLGCGDAAFGLELIEAGCRGYVGLESSNRMADLAKKTLSGTEGTFEHSTIEAWSYPPKAFDLVISRLALHYVANLDDAFANVRRTLKPNGRFVFSIVHPVITSSDKSRQAGGQRHDWIVDNYFNTGPRQVHFMGTQVEQLHRPLEEIYLSMQKAGFLVECLRESRPRRKNFQDRALFERRCRIPLFLFLSGRKV